MAYRAITRSNPFWRWFWGTALVLTCLLSVALYKAAMPPGRPLAVVPAK